MEVNEINVDEYLVLAITCWRDSIVHKFLNSKGITNEEQWFCLGLNNSGTAIVNLPSVTTRDANNLSFILINQKKWAVVTDNDIYNNILLTLKNKKKIVYTHIGDNGISPQKIKIENTIKPIGFHQWNPAGEPLKGFLSALTNDQVVIEYQQAIEKLIEESLKKHTPHLISLSILCQGYLTAHGAEGFEISDDELQKKALNNKVTTEMKNWWKPAMDDIINGAKVNDSRIGLELNAVGLTNANIQLEEIAKEYEGGNPDSAEKFIESKIEIVKNAYTILSDFL